MRILFSGDHLLKEITPNVSLWSEEVDVLDLYLTNLKKLTELEIKMVLPGHGKPFSKFEKRIWELERHHLERCEEILLI
jgi:glyoxylase-like metal-dependent hydrolase (beta-lactamase superfamily II)